jgi:hypothetical protein
MTVVVTVIPAIVGQDQAGVPPYFPAPFTAVLGMVRVAGVGPPTLLPMLAPGIIVGPWAVRPSGLGHSRRSGQSQHDSDK